MCFTGAPLSAATCEFDDPTKSIDCVADICGTQLDCCSSGWTQECVEAAKINCAPSGVIMPFSCACSHSYCAAGEALDPLCDPCVHAVCSQSTLASCCSTEWNDACVKATEAICHVPPGLACQ
jgi:hypothetical protein